MWFNHITLHSGISVPFPARARAFLRQRVARLGCRSCPAVAVHGVIVHVNAALQHVGLTWLHAQVNVSSAEACFHFSSALLRGRSGFILGAGLRSGCVIPSLSRLLILIVVVVVNDPSVASLFSSTYIIQRSAEVTAE